MKPTEFANKLRHIAATIEHSKNPKRDLVLHDLKRVAIMLEETNVGPESTPGDDHGFEDYEWDRERRKLNKEDRERAGYPDDPGDFI